MGSVIKSSIDELTTSLSIGSTVVTPDSENYEASLRRWTVTAEKPASVVVFPTSAEDVSKVILWSKSMSLDLAVSGGGHAVSGSSSTDGGVCIDLSKMRKVSVDAALGTITAQGGALWEHVDSTAAEYGLAAVGGTVNHTGIGGLTLGGGFGWLTGAHGLAIDNLLSAEVVLANGSIVTASKTENQDLFWAIRGAGACFGVVTSFTFQGHEQKGKVWAGSLVFLPSQLYAVIEFANNHIKTTKGNNSLTIAFASPPPAHQPVVMVVVFYNGPEDDALEYFEPLLKLNPVANTTSMMPYPEVNTILNPLAGHGLRRTLKGPTFIPAMDPVFAEELFNDCASFTKEQPGAGQTAILLEFIPFNKTIEVQQHETAFANRGTFCNAAVWPTWEDPKLDDVCRGWTRIMAAKFEKEQDRMKAKGVDATTKDGAGAYVNYAQGMDYKARTMFGINAKRLVELKKRYDPENVFNKFCNLLA